MKKLVISFSVLMMIAGGTVSVLKWLNIGPFAVVDEAVKEEVVEEEPLFVDMDPLVISVFQGDKVAATVQLQIRLKTNGEKNEMTIKKLMPRLNSVFLQDLHSFIPRLLKTKEKLDQNILMQRLAMIGEKVTGTGVINNILIQSVNEMPVK